MLKQEKLSKEDWTVAPFLGLSLLGFITTILDFIFLQGIAFKFMAIGGLILIIMGGVLRMKARLELKKRAGFTSFIESTKLQIIKDHHLLNNGIHKHIRHPLYLGEILRNLGITIFFSSFYGALIIGLSSFFLIMRIEIEEKMLISAFGKYYKEYKKKTMKLIPYIY